MTKWKCVGPLLWPGNQKVQNLQSNTYEQFIGIGKDWEMMSSPAGPAPTIQGTGGPPDEYCKMCGKLMKKHSWIMKKRCEADWAERE